MFAFPGIWRRYQRARQEGRAKDRPRGLAFLTTTPNKLLATIDHDRMPVLLTREEEFEAWLHGAPHAHSHGGRSIRPGGCA